jgi:hypothetical protein
MYARGISRPNRRLKHRSTTLNRAFSPDGENALRRVQALPETGKMRVNLWARRDSKAQTRAFSLILRLSTQAGEKSRIRGFHALVLAARPGPVSSRVRLVGRRAGAACSAAALGVTAVP